VLHAIAEFGPDISPALPYLNAELGGWDYDAQNHVLLLKLSAGKWITLHPHKIAIRGCRDLEEAHALVAWIKGQLNEIYARRQDISPRFSGQAGLKVMEILRLLPMTNCKACGYATCMAYAAALREGETTQEDCTPLKEEKFRDQAERLRAYLESYGWRALDGE
jgi:ArsR family metal-binding transcriptional regulator